MNSFKEWLSDYLRYFILALALIVAVTAIVLGVRLYQNSQKDRQTQGDPDNIQIMTETMSEETGTEQSETEEQTEAHTEKETEKDTEKPSETSKTAETKKASETQKTAETRKTSETQKTTETRKTSETQKTAETRKAPETQKTSETQKTAETKPVIEIKTPETDPPQTDPPQTDPPQTDPPQPVYLTMTGTCYFRSYADYGDNIIGEYPAGTVVEFLEDVGGWYKVQVDGMVGYMGARFFQ